MIMKLLNCLSYIKDWLIQNYLQQKEMESLDLELLLAFL